MTTPEYIRKAQNSYNAKFDIVQLKLPRGTKNRIKEAAGNKSMASFCANCILEALDRSQPEAAETTKKPNAPDKAEQPHDWDYVNRILAEKRAQIGSETPVHEEQKQLPEQQNEDDPDSVKMIVQRMLEQIREGKES